jgi:hypothetical protein
MEIGLVFIVIVLLDRGMGTGFAVFQDHALS